MNFDADDNGGDCIVIDELHVGLTRSATVGGVPVKPLMFALMAVAVLFTGSGKLFTVLLALPVYGILRLMSATNPRIFAESVAWLRVHPLCNNRLYWGAASFSPRRIRKWGKR